LILGHRDLIRAWKAKQIQFSPDIQVGQIGISSIDLHLGYVFSKLQSREGIAVTPSLDQFDPEGLVKSEDYSAPDNLGRPRIFRLGQHEFVVAFTLEEVHLPNNLAASVEGRTRLARYGLSVHTTAPHIHPAWQGPIALELYNHGPIPIDFRPGVDGICQLIFHQVTSSVPNKVAKSMSSFMGQKKPYLKVRS